MSIGDFCTFSLAKCGHRGALSSLQSRLWNWLFESRFRHRARKAGYSRKEAQWLIANIGRILDEEDDDF